MIVFILLVVVLVVFVTAFVMFLIFLKKMDEKTFRSLCEKKVKRFSKRNKLLAINKLHILDYARNELNIQHVIFGKKYIYIITDFMYKGFVKGEINDNSWVYYNTVTKKSSYINNLSMISDKNLQDFAGILGINADPIVSICLVPNECDFSIRELGNDRKMVVHYSSLNKKIKELEQRNIGSLNEQQIYEQYASIKERNK